MSAKKETAQRATTITLSMPGWMREEVKRQAKASNRSTSDYVKLILIEKLANVSIIDKHVSIIDKHFSIIDKQSEDHPSVCPASGCGTKKGCTLKTA
jgi:Cft2 family RNA processing exonuclease